MQTVILWNTFLVCWNIVFHLKLTSKFSVHVYTFLTLTFTWHSVAGFQRCSGRTTLLCASRGPIVTRHPGRVSSELVSVFPRIMTTLFEGKRLEFIWATVLHSQCEPKGWELGKTRLTVRVECPHPHANEMGKLRKVNKLLEQFTAGKKSFCRWKDPGS